MLLSPPKEKRTASRDSSLPGSRPDAPRNMGTLHVLSCQSGVILMNGNKQPLQVLTIHWLMMVGMAITRFLPLFVLLDRMLALTVRVLSPMPMFGLLTHHHCLPRAGSKVMLTWNERYSPSLTVRVCE